MDIQIYHTLSERKQKLWMDFLRREGLEPDMDTDSTVLIWEKEDLIATGSRSKNLLKCIAVNKEYQGLGLTATLLTHLRQEAFTCGHEHLFLYTKPKNLLQFSSLFFYPIIQTPQVLLMESEPNGISNFLETLPVPHSTGKVGALVMNCNPFTLGHQFLIETASRECDWVYVFVLSEEQAPFPSADRLMLAKEGTKHLANVTVLPTGPYLISASTFPTYFLKNKNQATIIQCELDIAIFTNYFIPKFGINIRYVGTEPLSLLTSQYNLALKQNLPITLREIPRLESNGTPISASTVRMLMNTNSEQLQELLPQTTLNYLNHFKKEINESCRNVNQPIF